MINISELKLAERKEVKVIIKDGRVFKGFCTEYLWPEDEDEGHNITIRVSGKGLIEINQSEIEEIIILWST